MTRYDAFAYGEYRDYVIYKKLLTIETSPEFRAILKKIIKHQFEHYGFWLTLSEKKEFSVPRAYILFFVFMRKALGLTFLLRFLEGDEKHAIEKYIELAKSANSSLKQKIEEIIEQETRHEKDLISQIKEEKIAFISSIVLGVNDGLIELIGTLTGFSFAFHNPTVIALSGLIAGIAAGLSMASAAYMQARHETGKDAKKSGIYTGVSYTFVVILLIAPFFIMATALQALAVMFGIALLIIITMSYYTATIFERRFARQFGEMLLFSLGVAIISFFVGSAFQSFIGVQTK